MANLRRTEALERDVFDDQTFRHAQPSLKG